VLLNILIALFNQAYSVVTGTGLMIPIYSYWLDNAVDEFLAVFSGKTLEYIRAPDENTYCPPYNLIQLFILFPLHPLLRKSTYRRLNQIIMKTVYFISLLLVAFYESQYFSFSKAS